MPFVTVRTKHKRTWGHAVHPAQEANRGVVVVSEPNESKVLQSSFCFVECVDCNVSVSRAVRTNQHFGGAVLYRSMIDVLLYSLSLLFKSCSEMSRRLKKRKEEEGFVKVNETETRLYYYRTTRSP